jgi:hypothetical protein
MYNPLEPWNAWFALSSQAARFCWATQAGMLRGIAQGGAKAEAEADADAETDRTVIENVGVGEAQIPAAARKSNRKHRVAKKASAVAAKRDRRNRHGFGPITIGSRKSKSTGCQASGRGALGGVRRVMLLNFDARFTSESGTNERSQTVVIDGLPLY